MQRLVDFLSFGLVVLVFTTGMAWGTPALADNHCHKNHNKNCNQSEKNQNSSPKINCEIHIEAEDHLDNNDFGPNEQQCLNNSNNIKDSTVTQNPPIDGSGSTPNPTISINPTSGSVFTSVTVTGNGFAPGTPIALIFIGSTVSTISPTSSGGFTTTFIVPFFSPIGDQTVKAIQGSNSASKTFKVTAFVNPIISLDPGSGPVGTPVNITGVGFDPSSTVTIKFNGSNIPTTPASVTTTTNGFFSANFIVPTTTIGPVSITATEGAKTDSETFTVTSGSTSLTTTSSQSNVAVTVPSSPNFPEKMILPDIFA